MVDIRLPSGMRDWFVLIVVIISAWLFIAASGLMTWIIGTIIVIAVAYLLYVVLYRTNKTIKDGRIRRQGGRGGAGR